MMNIRSRSTIHQEARRTLDRAPNTRQIVLIYAAVCCGLSLIATLLSVFFSDRISGTGGLGSIGLRSVLSTGQSVLPLVQSLVTLCLGLGYHIAILTVTRGYDADSRVLLQGFRHFGPLIRVLLIQSGIYLALGFAGVYLSSFLFLMTPFSADFVAVVEPLISSMTVMDSGFVMDEATLTAASQAIMPIFLILIPVMLILLVPVYFRFRMVTFCLAEAPRQGALAALFKSRRLMHRNCMALFRLDLSLWWFYLGSLLISLLCYGDVLLPMLGITLPWSDTVSFYGFYILSLVLQMVLYYFGMNRVTAVYAVAYDCLQDALPQAEVSVQM